MTLFLSQTVARYLVVLRHILYFMSAGTGTQNVSVAVSRPAPTYMKILIHHLEMVTLCI